MYMREDIINFLEIEVKNRCEKDTNFFGMGVYYHIKAVVKNAKVLAEEYGADEEVVIIAAWLHDIASITDYKFYEEHHIYGANIAERVLNEFNYDINKIFLVKKCILNHRGSKLKDKQTFEELCVADADAISHFDSVPSLFYLAYIKRKLNIEEGTKFVKDKLERSYRKLSDNSKRLYEEKYKRTIENLN